MDNLLIAALVICAASLICLTYIIYISSNLKIDLSASTNAFLSCRKEMNIVYKSLFVIAVTISLLISIKLASAFLIGGLFCFIIKFIMLALYRNCDNCSNNASTCNSILEQVSCQLVVFILCIISVASGNIDTLSACTMGFFAVLLLKQENIEELSRKQGTIVFVLISSITAGMIVFKEGEELYLPLLSVAITGISMVLKSIIKLKKNKVINILPYIIYPIFTFCASYILKIDRVLIVFVLLGFFAGVFVSYTGGISILIILTGIFSIFYYIYGDISSSWQTVNGIYRISLYACGLISSGTLLYKGNGNVITLSTSISCIVLVESYAASMYASYMSLNKSSIFLTLLFGVIFHKLLDIKSEGWEKTNYSVFQAVIVPAALGLVFGFEASVAAAAGAAIAYMWNKEPRYNTADYRNDIVVKLFIFSSVVFRHMIYWNGNLFFKLISKK